MCIIVVCGVNTYGIKIWKIFVFVYYIPKILEKQTSEIEKRIEYIFQHKLFEKIKCIRKFCFYKNDVYNQLIKSIYNSR